MTADLYDQLRFAPEGNQVKDALVSSGATIIAEGQTRPFVSTQTRGYRCLFLDTENEVWMAVQFAAKGEFTVMRSIDTPVNREAISKQSW